MRIVHTSQVLLVLFCCASLGVISGYTLRESQRLQKLQDDIEAALEEPNSSPLTGSQIVKNMTNHFKGFLFGVEKNIEKIFEPMVQGMKDEDDEKVGKELQYFVNCKSCYTIMDYIKEALYDTMNRQIILTVFQTQICSAFYDNTFCYDFTSGISDIISVAIDTAFGLMVQQEYVCHYVFPVCDEQKYQELKISDYERKILADKPAHIQNDDFLDRLYELIETQEDGSPDTYNIVQITDWHVDYRYTPGTHKSCSQEICCQAEHGFAEHQKDRARPYGELTCDIPYSTAEKQMEALTKIEDRIDMIIWTGDSVSHDVHHTSYQETIDTVTNLTSLLYNYFPNTPVVPVLGNHDFYPLNYFNPNYENQPNLDTIAQAWSVFLPEQAIKEFKRYGYYRYDMPSQLQRRSPQKVTVLGMNTQVCYNMNFGLMNETNDGSNHLHWFESQLQSAEKEGRVVLVAGHIAPGSYSCIPQWGNRYAILIERYQHIIRLSVYGHDHRELYEVARSHSTGKPIGINHVSGSLGTYLQVQPTVRLFKMHAKYHVPLEFKVLEFNLEEANSGTFRFQETHQFSRDFKLANLSPSEFSKLTERFLKDDATMQDYYKFIWKHGTQSSAYCDKECKKSMYCESYYSVSDKKVMCLQNDFEKLNTIDYIAGMFMNPWVQKV